MPEPKSNMQEGSQVPQRSKGFTIPPQPQILVDLQIEQSMVDPNLDHITKLIEQDPGLAGMVLRTVNDDLSDVCARITCIKDAVQSLGLEGVIDLVSALSIKGSLEDNQVTSLNRYWDTAHDVAMACATLVTQLGIECASQAYALGLFHNCGMVVLNQQREQYDNIVQASYQQSDSRIIDVENEYLKTNHAVLGYYIAKSWKLPTHLCEVIADHHNAIAIFTQSHYINYDGRKKNFLVILKLAEHICALSEIFGDTDIDHEWNALHSHIQDHFGLSDYDLASLIDTVKDKF